MDAASAGSPWLHAGVVFAGGAILCLLLLSRAEMFDVWVEIAHNTRPGPTGPRYPGLGFLSFIFRLSGYLILVAGLVTSAGIVIGMIQTPQVDLRTLWSPESGARTSRPTAVEPVLETESSRDAGLPFGPDGAAPSSQEATAHTPAGDPALGPGK